MSGHDDIIIVEHVLPRETPAMLERRRAEKERRCRSLMQFVVGVVLVLAVVVVAVVASWVVFVMIGTWAEEVADPSLGSAKLHHIEKECPKECDGDTSKVWRFYSSMGHQAAENFMIACEDDGRTFRASDVDGGKRYRDCLKKLELSVTDPGFDRRRLLEWFKANATGICDGHEYDVVRLLSICPYDDTQRKLAEPLYSRADMVCMRPGGNVLPIHVGDRDATAKRAPCKLCERACEVDWRTWECCNERCADLQNDAFNCGACGVQCKQAVEQCTEGKCLPVLWDSCNCGASGHKCEATQMCYKATCVPPFTEADAKHAREMLQCREEDKTRLPGGDFSYTLITAVDADMQERTFFQAMDKKHTALTVHKARDVASQPSPPAEGSGSGGRWFS